MRKLDLSAVSSTVGLPVKSGSINHIQLAYQEAISGAIIGLIGASYDPTKVYRLNGVINSGSGSSYIISAGYVFFNGEVFLVDSATFSTSGSNIAVGTIATSFFSDATADGVEFTDGVVRNIHQIRKMVYGPALSGSGAGDFAILVNINTNIPQLLLTASSTPGNIAIIGGSYPNKTVYVPANGVLAAGLAIVGDVSNVTTTITVSFGSVGTTSYIVAGSIESNGTFSDDSTIWWSVKNKTATSFDVNFREANPILENINFGWAIIAI